MMMGIVPKEEEALPRNEGQRFLKLFGRQGLIYNDYSQKLRRPGDESSNAVLEPRFPNLARIKRLNGPHPKMLHDISPLFPEYLIWNGYHYCERIALIRKSCRGVQHCHRFS